MGQASQPSAAPVPYTPPHWVSRQLQSAYRKSGAFFLDRIAYRELAKLGYVSLFDRRPPEAKPPVWSDLFFIYKSVRERKPEVVVEFGSGCSTIIFAQALADNAADGAPGFLHSLDADPHWGRATDDSIPDRLREYCEVIISDAVHADVGGLPAWRFRDTPDVAADFVYLDGPAMTPERNAAIDVLDMEPRFQPGFRLLVDARYFNCAVLERHFKRRYRKKHRRVLRSTTYDLIE